jgi:hypothetical protein
MTPDQQEFISKCQAFLDQKWKEIRTTFEVGEPKDPLGEGHSLIPLIKDCLTSTTKTYHYVLPTQLLAKSISPELDVHSLQVAYNAPGAFDARTLAHKVIVPFDRANHRVLGGAPEPYVNNPVRVPAVIAAYREQQKAKTDWDKLVTILDAVEETNDAAFTKQVLEQVLVEIYKLLSEAVVVYPTPNRVSLHKANDLIEQYLATGSGGDRMEAVCTALFQTISARFGIFDDVRRERVNAPDAFSGMLADIECWLEDRVVLLVEVKDRALTLIQLDDKLDHARAKHIAEILFVAQSGKHPDDAEEIDVRIISEFASGQNVYVSNFFDFALGILILLGEAGRVEFLDKVGKELDRVHSDIIHRKAWAELLKQA